MNEGGLVPFELTVQILINALLANPAKVRYLDSILKWVSPRNVNRLFSPLNLLYFLYYEINGCNGDLIW
jgi:hypothetical protein